MKCSIKSEENEFEQVLQEIHHYPILGSQWSTVEAEIGSEVLEKTARESKAIQRFREIRTASDLLRLVLFYALSDWGLRLCGAWALLTQIGYLSDVAILKRFRKCRVWLGLLIGRMLQRRGLNASDYPAARIRIRDATCVSRPGSRSTDWRIHVSFDLGQFCIDGLELTDAHGGESLARFPSRPGEIDLVDAGYAFASGMGAAIGQGADVVVRINWRNVAVFTPEGQRLDMQAWLHTVQGPTERWVRMETPQGWVNLRLLAAPIPPEKAQQARRRLRERYYRKQKTVTQETLFAAGFVLLLTTLPIDRWTTEQVFTLYRVRWQIELVFKRLKGCLYLDALRAKDPELAQTYLLAKLLVALLIEQMTRQTALQQPDWFLACDRPVSFVRLTQFFYEALRQIVFGAWLSQNLSFWLFMLRRYFCDSPRSRPQQFAYARAFLDHLNHASVS